MDKTADSSPENKWLRPKEIKISALLPSSMDGAKGFESRRGFRPPKKLPQPFHAKNSPAFGSNGLSGKTARRGVPSQNILSEDAGQNIWSSSVRNPRLKTTTDNGEQKSTRGVVKGKAPADSKQSLLIEGNSLWNGDIAYASYALDHLSECVKEERRLREQLDMVKYEKLQAFRSITTMFRNYVQNPSIRSHPEAKTIARCSVVTKTLATIIQTFLRYSQSKQLIAGMRNLQEKMQALSVPYDRTAASVFSERANLSLGSDYDRVSRSVEDLLDEEEISKMKQLYFDYYDCEVVSIGSRDLSDASGTGPNEFLGSRSSSESREKTVGTEFLT